MNMLSWIPSFVCTCFLCANAFPLSTPYDLKEITSYEHKAEEALRETVTKKAYWALQQEPITVTASTSPRSAGGKHDFYSEGDYWWPNPKDPNGPYIRKDGLTNPDNFIAHRLAIIRFSQVIGALASAYRLTGDERYVQKALQHLQAWLVNPETKMNPNLQYAQAIKGVVTGRGIGIIDTIHLMEVAQGIIVMEKAIDNSVLAELKAWFTTYLHWLWQHPYSKEELAAKNNHGTCWVMQVASFAKLTQNDFLLQFCRDRYKEVLLPDQMAANGSFPLELERTKPYGYALFNLDAMAMICQILSTKQDDLWGYETIDHRSIKTGIVFLFPYIQDKSIWPYPKDVMYWDAWPIAQPALLFGANQFKQASWFAAWKALDHDPQTEEVIRNLPIRNPLIWF